MPFHLFECAKCEKEFEVMITFTEYENYKKRKLKLDCLNCGFSSDKHQKLHVGKTALIFKSGKWFKTHGEY